MHVYTQLNLARAWDMGVSAGAGGRGSRLSPVHHRPRQNLNTSHMTRSAETPCYKICAGALYVVSKTNAVVKCGCASQETIHARRRCGWQFSKTIHWSHVPTFSARHTTLTSKEKCNIIAAPGHERITGPSTRIQCNVIYTYIYIYIYRTSS